MVLSCLILFHSFFPELKAFLELYDVKKDRHQLKNLNKDVPPKFLEAKHRRLVDLATCSGASCRKAYQDSMDTFL